MRHTVFLAIIAVLAVAADDKKPDEKRDLGLLKGKWTIVSLALEGNAITDVLGGALIFDNLNVRSEIKNRVKKATFTIDAGKSPKQMDVTELEGPQRGKPLPGIYSLTGDELTICYPRSPSMKRPQTFESTERSGIMLIRLTRSKE
jgi:uncharacterized protein (TIGR03067 family)